MNKEEAIKELFNREFKTLTEYIETIEINEKTNEVKAVIKKGKSKATIEVQYFEDAVTQVIKAGD